MLADRRKVGLSAVAALAAMGCLIVSASAEPGVTNTTIKIGMFGPLTGATSVYGYPINNGAVAFYNDINAKGGINGRKIEIVHEDGGCDPAKTRAAVKKLIHRDDVFMIHGGNCSAAVFASREEFIENKVPYVVMAATMDKISDPVNRYVFTTTLPGTRDGGIILNFMKTIPNAKRFAIVKHADEWAEAKAAQIVKGYKDAGLDLVTTVELERKATDATAQVVRLQNANADAIVVLLYPAETAVFLRDAVKYGLKGPFLGTVATQDIKDVVERAGTPAAVENFYTASFLQQAPEHPDMKKYADLLRKSFPNDRLMALNFYGMSGAFVIADALQRAGKDLTREKFVDAMEATKDGYAGPGACKVNFSKDNHQGCLGGTMWSLVNGEIVNVGSAWRKVR